MNERDIRSIAQKLEKLEQIERGERYETESRLEAMRERERNRYGHYEYSGTDHDREMWIPGTDDGYDD